MARPPKTLQEVAYLRLVDGGMGQAKALLKATQVCANLWCLAYARHKLDYWPNQAEYAEYWKISERQASREWALFRAAFGDERKPADVARLVYAEMASRVADRGARAQVAALPADVALGIS